MGKHCWIVIAIVLTLAGSAGALGESHQTSLGVKASAAAASGWIVRSEDNICGLSDAKKLSNPGKLRYSELREATPEIKKMKEKQSKKEAILEYN